jgi:hypothetical protein
VGFLRDLFRLGRPDWRDILESVNPLSDMKLQEFVIADDSSEHLRHYFRFKNREAQDEEFIVIYRRIGGDMLGYARTHWRGPGHDKDFGTLIERGPWSAAISRLINMGQDLSSKTRVTRTHFSLQISAEELQYPLSSKPPTTPRPEYSAPAPVHPRAAKTLAARANGR